MLLATKKEVCQSKRFANTPMRFEKSITYCLVFCSCCDGYLISFLVRVLTFHTFLDVPVCKSIEPVVYGVGKGEMVDVFCDVVSNPQSYNFEVRLKLF